jgi:sulfate adenylyltransferase
LEVPAIVRFDESFECAAWRRTGTEGALGRVGNHEDGGIAICAPIAPYDATRKHVRQLIEPFGGFILVHIATTVEVCEQRDRKGLYAKARAGILKEFTGISDPYEAPEDAEVTINTGELTPGEAAQEIILHLEREGFIGVNRTGE